ncbi:tetratricopeptide repeat-containing diguanylate cyclase [Shewanella aestuarii]|uniref:diguanylate cyclase n=1 Tax=Shewanella aestuarii TaxID=1028752 RepID=A0A6G9QLF9_9GAMM|nr:GGDEF domain-containing protein [Shewanella aestuarii]QIR15424.1 GGDEF domain-containing protein [Shewanella aestuarii]
MLFVVLSGISPSAIGDQTENETRADEILLQLLEGLIPLEDDIQQAIAELATLIHPDDTERQKRYVRTYCWYQKNSTPELLQQGIRYADNQIILYSDPFPSEILADLYLCRGWFKDMASDPDGAFGDVNKGIEYAYKIDNPRLIADGRNIRGRMYSFKGNYSAALEDFITAQQLYESLNSPYWEAYNLSDIASTYSRFGDPASALKYQMKLEQYYIDSGQLFNANDINYQIAISFHKLKNYQQAIERLKKSQQYWLDEGHQINAELMSIEVAGSMIMLGQFNQAKLRLLQAKTHINDSLPNVMGHLYFYLAQVMVHENNLQQALVYFTKAKQAYQTSQNDVRISETLLLQSEVLAGLNRWQESFHTQADYIALHHQMDEKILDERNAEMQARFDTEQVISENELLIEAAKIKDAQFAIMQRNENMQIIIIILSCIILIFVSIFAYKQILTKRTFKRLALTDYLTNLSNRRDTYERGNDFLKQAAADNQPFSVISFDADYFKAVNDSLGHEVGDHVLIKLAELAANTMRETDLVGRVGGEEFLVLLPNTNKDTAIFIAQRLITTVAHHDWSSIAPELKQTISAGVASFTHEQSFESLLIKADEALYLAKSAGRNCVKAA